MIHRMNPFRTTTSPQPPTTTQFTLFPTFPTLFPPLFGTLTPMPFVLPQITTPGPIFNLPSTTTSIPVSQTTQIERKDVLVENGVDSKTDLDLLKPELKIPNRRSKIVGSRLQFKLGEKMNKQEGDEDASSTVATENPEAQTTESPDDETSSTNGHQDSTTKKADDDGDTTQSSTNSISNPSTKDDDNQTTQQPDSGKGSGDENSSGSGHKPDEQSGTPSPRSSGNASGDNNDDASGSGSGKPNNGGDSSGDGSKCTDGKWSEWKMKFPCSAECGACGQVQKERECLSFRNGKGCPCTGDYKVIEPCNIEVCRYPKPSCCPPYDLIHVDGVFACGPQEKHIMAEFKNATNFRKKH